MGDQSQFPLLRGIRIEMKIAALIILVLFLLQPLACFAHPCDSCLGKPDSADTSGTTGTTGSSTHSQDADNCDSTFCCAVYLHDDTRAAIIYLPLVSALFPPERSQKLPKIVIPIFIPPQKLA
jgi:hypothetical protein